MIYENKPLTLAHRTNTHAVIVMTYSQNKVSDQEQLLKILRKRQVVGVECDDKRHAMTLVRG